MPDIHVKRVYDDPSPDDGVRILADRLWPRGISREKAMIDDWAKELTPSTELRTWFHASRDERQEEFAVRYAAELDTPEQQGRLAELRERIADSPATLLTAAKDPEHSHVPILLTHLQG